MPETQFKSAISDTISNLLSSAKEKRLKNTLDYSAFVNAIKKEMIKNDLPFFNIEKSKVNRNIIILELPFTKDCEISITPTMFGSEKKEAAIKINDVLVRRIRLQQFDAVYMSQVAMALVDYLKRYLVIKNRVTSKEV